MTCKYKYVFPLPQKKTRNYLSLPYKVRLENTLILCFEPTFKQKIILYHTKPKKCFEKLSIKPDSDVKILSEKVHTQQILCNAMSM